MHALFDILREGLLITGFVLIMMLVIEYLNVLTRGNWDRVISRWTWGQSAFAALLGVTPGCLGAYAAASLYIHRILSIGALSAAMIATCGDEAFMMLALFPATAIKIFAVMFVSGLVTGILIDLATRSRLTKETQDTEQYTPHHEHPECVPASGLQILKQWRSCSPHRGWLALFLILFLGGVLSGTLGHMHLPLENHAHEAETTVHDHDSVDAVHAEEADLSRRSNETKPDLSRRLVPAKHRSVAGSSETEPDWNWVRITLLMSVCVALLIVAIVPDHFLDEHLWHHLIKIHAWRVLLWTFGALIVAHLIIDRLDLSTAIESHKLPMLLLACLVGLLPVSGPHLVFVVLFAGNAIPLSILMANCIVQEGHGLIPTLAHSRRAFFFVKGIKLILALALGLAGHLMGW